MTLSKYKLEFLKWNQDIKRFIRIKLKLRVAVTL